MSSDVKIRSQFDSDEAIAMGSVPYHTRMAVLGEALEAHALGDVELAGLYSGKADQPIQVVLRDRKTLRVHLIDLNPDGSITVDGGLYAPLAA
jgi:hypothetical protein